MARKTAAEFLTYEWPAREFLVEPWLPARGIVMIAGFRGLGKTFASLGAAVAVAGGERFLGWQVPKARKCLYVDGEMDPAQLQDRLRGFVGGLEAWPRAQALENLHLLSHAEYPVGGIPDLADPLKGGRRLVEAQAEDCDLVVLDNLSALCRSGIENDADGWHSMQEWLLGLRRAGKTVLLVHHGGKPDQEGRSRQRGTSKREDILDASVMLQRTQGMPSSVFTWEYTKARGFLPEDPFQVAILWGGGAVRLERHEAAGPGSKAEPNRKAEALIMLAQGRSLAEVKAKTGISRTVLSDMRKGSASGARIAPAG